DGLTVVLNAQAVVNPGQTNTIKLAIADTDDSIYDSAVMIKSSSIVACQTTAIVYGQTINANLNASSCVINGPTDVYTFSGTAGQNVAIGLDPIAPSGISTSALQLIAP